MDIEQHGKMTLTNIEFTTTHLCNMSCTHCAVGHTLTHKIQCPPYRATHTTPR